MKLINSNINNLYVRGVDTLHKDVCCEKRYLFKE